ncbi:hypothetical protein ACFCVY_22445 [Streptomyces sp. NPDC056411]|uniref:hypothetical protein n=1 Tax=Streptomyces sp. NPDC056411 TaxID=3345813 RepID=UPI0035D5AA00
MDINEIAERAGMSRSVVPYMHVCLSARRQKAWVAHISVCAPISPWSRHAHLCYMPSHAVNRDFGSNGHRSWPAPDCLWW